jgi:hypothetical protein
MCREGEMSFETISLLLNWSELGALLAILFRLGHTFELIAGTQRELRRAIHHLGEHRSAEPGGNTAFDDREIALVCRLPGARSGAESAIISHDLAGLAPKVNS